MGPRGQSETRTSQAEAGTQEPVWFLGGQKGHCERRVVRADAVSTGWGGPCKGRQAWCGGPCGLAEDPWRAGACVPTGAPSGGSRGGTAGGWRQAHDRTWGWGGLGVSGSKGPGIFLGFILELPGTDVT